MKKSYKEKEKIGSHLIKVESQLVQIVCTYLNFSYLLETDPLSLPSSSSTTWSNKW